MQLGLVGLGRMGANMARRWLAAGPRVRRLRARCGRRGGACAARAWSSRRRSPSSSELLPPPRAIWIMIPAAAVDGVIDALAPQLAAGRHRDRRRQLALRRRRAPRGRARRARRALSRRRRQRRHLRPRARLLPHDRRRRRRRGAPRAAVRVARARAAPSAPPSGGTARARLLALRPERRGPLRQDGAQRHRVRPHGRLRRRVQSAARSGRRHARRARRRGDGAAHACKARISHTTSISRRSRSCGATAASCARGCSISRAPRSRATRRSTAFAARSRTPAKAAGRSTPPSTPACRCPCSRRRCSRASLARPGRVRQPRAVGDAARVRRPRRAHRAAPRRSRAAREPPTRRTRSCCSVPRATSRTRRSFPRCKASCGAARSTCPSSASRAAARESRACASASATASKRAATASTPRRSRGSRSSCATSTATTARPRRSRALREALGDAAHPLHYLAMPPSLFATVADQLRESGCADGARVVVEKPFGRDLASALELNDALHRSFAERVHLPHRSLPRQGVGAEPAVLPLRELVPRADLEPQLRRARADHDGRELRRRGRGKFYEEVGAIRDVVQNHLLQVVAHLAMEPPVGADADALRDEKVKVFKAIRTAAPDDLVRGQYRGYRRRGGRRRRIRTSRPMPRCGSTSTRGAGPACRSICAPGKALAATATEVFVDAQTSAARVFPRPGAPNYLRFRLGPDSRRDRARRAREKLRHRDARPRGRAARLRRGRDEIGAYERLIGAALRRHVAVRARGRGARGVADRRCDSRARARAGSVRAG